VVGPELEILRMSLLGYCQEIEKKWTCEGAVEVLTDRIE